MRLVVLLCLALLAGCTSMQRYGTARTLPEGEVAFTAAVDLVQGYEPQLDETFDAAFPVAPRVGVRYGIAAATEVGFEAGAVNATLDVKRELLRSRWFDLAVAPAITGGWRALPYGSEGDEPVFIAQLPVLAGIHATDWLTLVPQASVGYGWRSLDQEQFYPPREDEWIGTGLVSGGLGLFVRVSDWLAVQPLGGITVELDSGYRYTSGGVGFLFGEVPSWAE